jgi:hypothetical protein
MSHGFPYVFGNADSGHRIPSETNKSRRVAADPPFVDEIGCELLDKERISLGFAAYCFNELLVNFTANNRSE